MTCATGARVNLSTQRGSMEDDDNGVPDEVEVVIAEEIEAILSDDPVPLDTQDTR